MNSGEDPPYQCFLTSEAPDHLQMTETLGRQLEWQHAQLKRLPSLKPGELHIFWLPLSLPRPKTQIALSLLSDIQRDKYHRRADGLQRAYLAGRYYLLQLLGAYTGTEADQVLLSYGRLNKPYLSDQEINLHFNFTDTRHDRRYHGVFAFSREHAIGVDVEARNRSSDFQRLMDKRFTPQEKAFVTAGGELDPQRFLAIWTRKEAFGKATGQGINFKMNQQDLASNSHELDFYDAEHRAWRLMQFELGEHLIASAVHAGHQNLAVKSFHSLEI